MYLFFFFIVFFSLPQIISHNCIYFAESKFILFLIYYFLSPLWVVQQASTYLLLQESSSGQFSQQCTFYSDCNNSHIQNLFLFDRWVGGRVKCSLIFDRFPSLFVFVGQDLQVGIKPQQCCGELSVTDRRFSCIFLQTMARSAQQTVAPMGHLSPFYLQFSYKCAYLPLP